MMSQKDITSYGIWAATSKMVKYLHSLLTTLLLMVVALGPLPHHVGFVMDGNRRYARSHGQRASRGHQQGFESLKRTLQLCLRLRIPVVSVYAFAIDNFNRPQEEVDILMSLAKESLVGICRAGDFLHSQGVRVRCIGRTDLLSSDVQEALREMEAVTADNTQGVLNVCGPYASRDEITSAVRLTVEQITDETHTLSDVTSRQVFDNLATCRSARVVSEGIGIDCGKLDILVRTSDVRRLSDFMMWQSSGSTQIHFVKTFWPDFGLSDLFPILLGWQQKVVFSGFR